MRGMAVPYVTNRAIQNRLDEVCGPENWYNEFKPWHSNGKKDAQLCGIAIYFEGKGFITKWDGAEDSDIEPIKGGLSDSMKRAAYQWGIGRVLYSLDTVWVDIERRGRSYVIKASERKKLDDAYLNALKKLGLEPAAASGIQSLLTPKTAPEQKTAGGQKPTSTPVQDQRSGGTTQQSAEPQDRSAQQKSQADPKKQEHPAESAGKTVPFRNAAQAMPDLSGGDDLISSYYGSVRYFSWKSLVYATSQESSTNTYFNMWGTTSGLPTGNYSYNIYEGIRYAYNFLNNIGSVPDISEANLRYWSGEAHFLIAHLHQILLEYYGPIVLAREEIDLNAPASSVNVPRSTYDECVNFIEEEFRKAADMLPDYWGPIAYGRAIKATALAYRARLLLYAASPLVNGNSECYADFVNKDGTHLINQTYDAEKWKRAMDAAKEAIDCVEASKETGAYTMDDRQLGLSVSKSTSTTDPFELGRANYTYIFTGDGNATQFLNQNEYLMSLNKSGSITYTQKQFGCHLANNYTKVSGAYRGYLCPTFEAVQMYYTRNGLPWEDDPETKDIDPLAYNKAAGTVEMHLHKEPRFYASVGYDRGTYRFNGGKMTIKAHKGEPQGFTGSYDNEYQSYNGYFCQKWVNEQSKMTLNSSGNYSVSTYMSYVFPYMRIAELYLSYAEADFEYDGTLSDYGYECLNKIRSRCGLPTFQDSWSRAGGIPSGQKLRDIIRRERSIEFMLEGRRFHDIRRWKIAEECLRPIPKAWNIEGDTPEKFYKLVDMKENDTRIFTTPKHYWLAIPNSQLNINGQLVQNPGY